jgi:RND superfamily putative drug exporter
VRSPAAGGRARGDLVSPDGTTATLVVAVSGSPADAGFRDAVDGIRRVARADAGSLEVHVTGPAGILRDTTAVFAAAGLALLAVTVLLVLALLLVVYRSPLLVAVPLVAVSVALEITNGIGAELARLGWIEVNSQAASIMTVLLFGVGTDYCLFLVSRYRERLGAGDRPPAALATAVSRVAGVLAASAAIVVSSLLVLLLASLPVLRGFGPLLAISVAVMLVVAVTLVPALLVLFGRAAFWPGQAWIGPGRGLRVWTRIADAVTRRPVAALGTGLALLVLLAAPLAGYRESYDFVSGFRVDTDSRQGEMLLRGAFPAGQLAPTEVLVACAAGTPDDRCAAVTARVVRAAAAVPGVRGAAVEARSDRGGRTVTVLSVVYADDPYGPAALDRARVVRESTWTAAAGPGGAGARVLVGGESAQALDTRSALTRDLAVVAPVMLLLIGVVLGVLLRSVTAPLYLLAAILASFLATLGLTVLATVTLPADQGIGERVTIYIFVFLVALGIDYTMLLMGRLREEAARTADFRAAVRAAVAGTGGVISSAGVILAGTFAVLMTQPIRELFQFGFAMAAGVLLDTFVVRGAVVPAVVALLGRASLWPSAPSASAAGEAVVVRLDEPGTTASSG